MMHLCSLALILFAAQAFGLAEIRDVTVEGDGVATARVGCLGCPDHAPPVRVSHNQIEITWSDAVLSEKHQGKFEVAAPHALLQRVSLFPSEKNTVKGIFAVRGSTEDLEKRIQVAQTKTGTTVNIAFPNATSTALALLKSEEEKPIASPMERPKVLAPQFGKFQVLGVIAIVLLAAFTSIFGARWLKQRGKLSGSRRFLIEKIAQMPLESKSSVCLLKIGTELVLVGVTSQNVTFLSSMPRLQDQYDSESRLERRAFKDAVEDEFRRLKDSSLTA